jgi:hypothetical protein
MSLSSAFFAPTRLNGQTHPVGRANNGSIATVKRIYKTNKIYVEAQTLIGC